MARFHTKKSNVTTRAEWWAESEHVTIKRLTFGDREAIQARSFKVKPMRKGEEEPEIDFDLSAGKQALLETALVSWCLHDEDGAEVSLTPAHIAELTEEDAAFILQEIERVNPKS